MRPENNSDRQGYRYFRGETTPRHNYFWENELEGEAKKNIQNLVIVRGCFEAEIKKSQNQPVVEESLGLSGIKYSHDGRRINLVFSNFTEGIDTEFFGDLISVRVMEGLGGDGLFYKISDTRNDKPLIVSNEDLPEIISGEVKRLRQPRKRVDLF